MGCCWSKVVPTKNDYYYIPINSVPYNYYQEKNYEMMSTYYK